ncbi:hypothetical protein ACIGFJ_05265 [Brevundimonas diminuta]|uniref:hypothetical protein n=1 Tax=Brevundimonas TaxID=41275 RepID=UPI000627BDAB|nr:MULTISPECIES: hypothetical protein [Brevundimonas]OMG60360.1 hypothetical protein BJP32_04375 [Brevundimonas sp. ZS04]
MSLVEIARYQDVYEADLAAAFLSSHDIEVSVTERFQTTIDPLMQRALGIRLMGRADQASQARDLLARAGTGEFATDEGDDLDAPDTTVRTASRGLALFAFATGAGFVGTAMPRRFNALQWAGLALIAAILLLSAGAYLWAWVNGALG